MRKEEVVYRTPIGVYQPSINGLTGGSSSLSMYPAAGSVMISALCIPDSLNSIYGGSKIHIGN